MKRKEAGPQSHMYNMEAVKRVKAVETKMRKKTGKGKMTVKRTTWKTLTCPKQLRLEIVVAVVTERGNGGGDVVVTWWWWWQWWWWSW